MVLHGHKAGGLLRFVIPAKPAENPYSFTSRKYLHFLLRFAPLAISAHVSGGSFREVPDASNAAVPHAIIAIPSAVHAPSADGEPVAMGIGTTRSHNEHWDGAGSPRGEETPLSMPIFALVACCDSLLPKRCDKPTVPDETCTRIVKSDGAQFDPLIAVFSKSPEVFRDVLSTMNVSAIGWQDA